MPYVKFGLDPIHHGKKLFDLLCNLKNFGQGRIIYSCLEQKHTEPSFYRILLAQPEMDTNNTLGRLVTERVYRGMRYATPFNLTGELQKQMQFPDYRLVPKGKLQKLCGMIVSKIETV